MSSSSSSALINFNFLYTFRKILFWSSHTNSAVSSMFSALGHSNIALFEPMWTQQKICGSNSEFIERCERERYTIFLIWQPGNWFILHCYLILWGSNSSRTNRSKNFEPLFQKLTVAISIGRETTWVITYFSSIIYYKWFWSWYFHWINLKLNFCLRNEWAHYFIQTFN